MVTLYCIVMLSLILSIQYASSSSVPSIKPSLNPTNPTITPSKIPSKIPSVSPTIQPTLSPTVKSTIVPSFSPTSIPSTKPSSILSGKPTVSPTNPTTIPTRIPSITPSLAPTMIPSTQKPSITPTCTPSRSPTNPTYAPTRLPSSIPTSTITNRPSASPTIIPSSFPTLKSSNTPTCFPTKIPTTFPTINPTNPTCSPTINPSKIPSYTPSTKPSSSKPSIKPSLVPSIMPTMPPTSKSSITPSCIPTTMPTYVPTINPTNPTCAPTINPSYKPTIRPSYKPTRAPTKTPSANPTMRPIAKPTSSPSSKPSAIPSRYPSLKPTAVSTTNPTNPTAHPTTKPSRKPTLFNANNIQYDYVQRYEAIDPLTFDIYTQHWNSYHSKWIGIDPDAPYCEELAQSVSYPICIDDKLVRDSYYGSDISSILGSDQVCPNVVCLAKTSSVPTCSVSSFDTIDYLPPIPKNSLDSNYICNNSHISIENWIDPNISATTFTLDLGIPPLYIPIIPVRLQIQGKVLSILDDQCIPIKNAEITAWQIDPTLLSLYNLKQQYHYAVDSELNSPKSKSNAFSNSAAGYQTTNGIPKTILNQPQKPSLRDVSGRATQHTSSTGTYEFLTFLPPSYGPPRHIMFQITAPGYKTLTTRVYFDLDWRLQQLTTLHGKAEDTLDPNSLALLLGFPYDQTVSENSLPGPIAKDPRVAKLEFIATSNDIERNIVSGKFSTEYNFVLSPLRTASIDPISYTLADGSENTGIPNAARIDESLVPPYDITGLWSDLNTGGQIKIETFGPSVILAEYPHARTWGMAIGMIVGNTIRGVDFKQIRTIEDIDNARKQIKNPGINFNPSSTTWISSGLSNGNILTSNPFSSDPFSTEPFNTIVQQPEVMSIRWSSGDVDGYNNIWTHQLQDTVSGSKSPQFKELGYRFLKLLINRETGGFSGGKMILNEIEFFEGVLAQQQVPLVKMQTPRFPVPQRVSCSTFQDQPSHCYKAFDGDTTSNSAWITKPIGSRRNVISEPQWVTFDFGQYQNVRPTAMRLFCDIQSVESKDSFVALGCPMTFTLLGSNDNVKYDLIYQDDLYDYKGDYGKNGKTFYFIFETTKGRVNGQQCGSCTMGPDFICQLQAYDSTCDSRYCGSNGLCALEPICPPGEYMKYGFTGYSQPAFQCKKCAAGRYSTGGTNQQVVVKEKLLASQCDGLCAAGYYCKEGSITSTEYPCGDIKYFCPEGSPSPTLAGAGRYTINSLYNQTTVNDPVHRVAEILCEVGYYCKNGEKILCPIGRYGNTIGLQTNSCSGECEAGTYCPLGTINPIICPLGHYCPDGRTQIICPAGTYGASLGLKDDLCSGLCSLGHYCLAGSISSISRECPPGRFGETNGLTNSSCSGVCSAGYYCPSASVSKKERPCGGSSLYCPESSYLPTIVTPGYYTIGGDSIYTRSAQQLVEPGFYTVYGIKWPCRAGTYGAISGLTIDDKYHLETALPTNIPTPMPTTLPTVLSYTRKPTIGTTHAPVVSYIPTSKSTVIPTCSPSTSRPSSKPSVSSSVKPSHSPSLIPSFHPSTKPSSAPSFRSLMPTAFPSSPSINPTITPSRPPTYKPTNMQPTSTPTSEIFRTYTPTFAPTLDLELPIDSFYACTGYCMPGYYCPINSITPQPCPAGRYGATSSLINPDCTDVCPLGHYCPEASVKPIQCPPGVFGNATGLTDSTCSANCWVGGCDPNQQLCFAGFYCPIGSIQGNQIPCGDTKYYCPVGSFLPTMVSPGYYTIGEPDPSDLLTDSIIPVALTRTSQTICEEGNFCVDGVKSKCPAGYYGVSKGLQTPYCSGPCPKGYYCPEGSFNGTTHRCPAGRYGATTGLYDSSCSGHCNPGYHCYEASISPTQLECAVLQVSGDSYNGLGILHKDFIVYENITMDISAARVDVYLNDFNSTHSYLPNTNRTIQVLSNPNSVYCPLGTSIPLTIRPGYYSIGYNQTTRYAQIPCPLGSYCEDGVINDCPAGRYGRAERLTSALCTGACTKGHYCPAGSISSTQYPCPIGRYGLSEGLGDSFCSGACGHALDCPIGSVNPRPRNEF